MMLLDEKSKLDSSVELDNSFDESFDWSVFGKYAPKLSEQISAKQEASPKRYIYELCDKLDWAVPMFTDPAAGGYRLRYFETSEEEANKVIEELQTAAGELGIKLLRPSVRPARKGAASGFYATVIVPHFDGKN